ncbi:MAG: hypothetical protein GDA49_06725 [Rhodospirillales bacterium]|nr:hypothetical protein [Rhodospirillales bacterium]
MRRGGRGVVVAVVAVDHPGAAALQLALRFPVEGNLVAGVIDQSEFHAEEPALQLRQRLAGLSRIWVSRPSQIVGTPRVTVTPSDSIS